MTRSASAASSESGTQGNGQEADGQQGQAPPAEGGEETKKAAEKPGEKPADGEAGVIAALTRDHREVEALFAKYASAGRAQKARIIQQVCQALTIHTMLEEELFYPKCREAAKDDDPLDDAQVEHDSAKLLIADLLAGQESDPFRDAKVRVLAEQIAHHVREEEEAGKGIFARAKSAGVDTPELARRLKERKQQLQASGGNLPRAEPVSINTPGQSARNAEENEMANTMQQNRDRDDRGRFAQHDDDHYGRGGSNTRGRDEDGRFTGGNGGRFGGSYREEDDRGNRGARGYDDDNRRYYRSGDHDDEGRRGMSAGRGQGGWHGESEGRPDASRRGWDNSEGRSGWYGDSRGQPDSSRRGWYGDSLGHSEASQRGWDERGQPNRPGMRGRDEDRSYRPQGRDEDDRSYRARQGDDDGRSYRSRSRDDDDEDRRGSSGRGQGGWFGDAQGHAEASRRGWENRR